MSDPFRTFTMECETPLRQARALIIASNRMLVEFDAGSDDDIIVDALTQLTNDAWTHLDRVLEQMEAALAAAREGKAA